jgi:hypothetical protein
VISEAGQKIYEWEQTIDEVHVFFALPPGTVKSDLEISIRPKMMTIGSKGNPPYLAQPPWAPVDAGASLWFLEEAGELHVQLQKVREAETWAAAFEGHGNLNSVEEEISRKQILLERFQKEHPSFDFSGAEVSGAVPDPRTFLN